MGLAKLTASLLRNFRSLETLENLLFLAVEGFGGLPNLPLSVQKAGLKEYTFRKKKATENGIGLKEYTNRQNSQLNHIIKFFDFHSVNHNNDMYALKSVFKFVPTSNATFEIPSITHRDGKGRYIKLFPTELYGDIQHKFS